MSKTIHEKPEFYLPAEFLTDEDILMDNKENFPKNKVEEQLVNLTRQLSIQKPDQKIQSNYNVCSGSSSDGSPNIQSPTSHFAPTSNSLDLIYQAAVQVYNLKTNGVHFPLENNRSLLSQQNSSALYNSFVERVRGEQILNYRQQRSVWSNNQLKNGPILNNRFSGGYLVNDESAWPSLQYVMQQKKSGNCEMFPNGGYGNGYQNSVRKPSAGTGVFLPRCYENKNNRGGIPSRTNKNKGGCSTSSLRGTGERSTAHANARGCVQPRWQPSRGEVQLAQKNATMLMHQRNTHLQQQVVLGHELGLPQEWTY